MTQDRPALPETLALSTEVEEDFVSPLTAMRGALEILRDHPDLTPDERRQFVEMALDRCGHLEAAVRRLATTVYAAASRVEADPPDAAPFGSEASAEDLARIRFDAEHDLAEVDLSGFVFDGSGAVNAFYDLLDRQVARTGRTWHFIVNYQGCAIWPEAWVAFAHRAKRVQATYADATVRYASADDAHSRTADAADPDFVTSREAAIARIAEIRAAT